MRSEPKKHFVKETHAAKQNKIKKAQYNFCVQKIF